MNENSKTGIFLAAAVVLLGFGVWLSRPSAETDDAAAEIGRDFFPEFIADAGPTSSPARKVAEAEIVELDPRTDAKHEIKIARVDGEFQINPEKQGYDQVSIDRMADVINAVIGVKKLSVITDDPTRHREFAVVDPTNEAELKAGGDGTGKRVTLKSDNGKVLFDLIVGKIDDKIKKPDPHAELDFANLPKPIVYVRVPGKDRVYTTELQPSRLSSSFSDWALGDLLGVGSSSLEQVFADDYGIDFRQVRQRIPGLGDRLNLKVDRIFKAKGDFKKESGKWAIGKLEVYDEAKKAYVERKPADDENVVTTKLDDLGRALAGLKVVDAVRKPKAIVDELLAGKDILNDIKSPVWQNEDAVNALLESGFQPSRTANDKVEYICHDGELTVGFANGVRYHLYFGDITGKGRAGKEGEAKEGDAKAGEAGAEAGKTEGSDEAGSTAPNRYLMVSASFDQSLIPPPVITKLPPEDGAKPAEEKKTEAAIPAEAKPAENKADDKKPEEKKPDDAKPAEKKADEAKSEAKPSGDGCDAADEDQLAQAEPTKTEEKKPADAEKKPAADAKADAAKPADDKKAADSKSDAPKSDAKKADDKDAKPEAAKPADAKPAEPKVVDPPMTPVERKRIQSENEQNQKKYDDDVKAGREKAKQLNDQFAEWFYVVSDETFEKIHFDPQSVLEKKPAEPAPAQPNAGGLPGMPNLPKNLQDMLPKQ
ncbi:MAG: hypothetical protein JNL96_11435 [Planctomycetaceae bacterium]|nr:hypothetical protein [Planctomycetaceae bacterium]